MKGTINKVFRRQPPVGSARGPDEAVVRDGLRHSFTTKRIAKQLTASLYAGFVDPPEQEPARQPADDPRPWPEALLGFLREAAGQGVVGNGRRERRDWSWVLCGVGGKEPSTEDIGRWADQMRHKVAAKWREKLPWLVAHFHHGAERESMRTLIESSRVIAQNTLRWLTVGIPAVLLGGGAVALLVLFIDKG